MLADVTEFELCSIIGWMHRLQMRFADSQSELVAQQDVTSMVEKNTTLPKHDPHANDVGTKLKISFRHVKVGIEVGTRTTCV